MGISIRNSQNQIIVDIHGLCLDEKLLKILRATLLDLINHGQVNILINMSMVNSIESSALGCLIAAQKKCCKRGGEINIYGIQPDILMIFYIIRLDEHINLYNNEQDALNCQNRLIRRRFKLIKR